MSRTVDVAQAARVLVVEDELRLRTLLQDVIPSLGFRASTAGSAEAALSILQRDPHDIAMLDLNLPGMGGMELFKHIRERWPSMPVVILSAYGTLDDARQAIRMDVVDFVSKPFHLCDIEHALARAQARLDRRSSRLLNPVQTEWDEAHGNTLAEVERQRIIEALDRNDGNRTRAARELGISRRTLHYRLLEYGIGRPE